MFSPPTRDSEAAVTANLEEFQERFAISLVRVKGGKFSDTITKDWEDQNADAIISDNAVRLRDPWRDSSDEDTITLEDAMRILAE